MWNVYVMMNARCEVIKQLTLAAKISLLVIGVIFNYDNITRKWGETCAMC